MFNFTWKLCMCYVSGTTPIIIYNLYLFIYCTLKLIYQTLCVLLSLIAISFIILDEYQFLYVLNGKCFFFPQNEHFSLPLRILQVTGQKNEYTKILEQVFYKQTQELLLKFHGEEYQLLAIYHWIPLHRIR